MAKVRLEKSWNDKQSFRHELITVYTRGFVLKLIQQRKKKRD